MQRLKRHICSQLKINSVVALESTNHLSVHVHPFMSFLLGQRTRLESSDAERHRLMREWDVDLYDEGVGGR